MSAFLLTWNPKRYGSWESLAWIMKHRNGSWSCGSRREMPRGSRVFLLKQGSEPRGLVASGSTVGDVYQDEHWDPERARKGISANYVDVAFDTVAGADPDVVLPVSQLNSAALRRVNWRTQMSGIQIPDAATAQLERVWRRFAGGEIPRASARRVAAHEGTLTEMKVYVRKRDRRLRDQAMVESEGQCEACRRDYWTFLGGLGRRALQVHHRKQLSADDRPRLTRTKDLAVVCANCHAMIHSDPHRAMPVEQLRKMLARSRKQRR